MPKITPPLLFLASIVAMRALLASPLELHVSPTGKSSAGGTATDPLASLQDAVTAIKLLSSDKKNKHRGAAARK